MESTHEDARRPDAAHRSPDDEGNDAERAAADSAADLEDDNGRDEGPLCAKGGVSPARSFPLKRCREEEEDALAG